MSLSESKARTCQFQRQPEKRNLFEDFTQRHSDSLQLNFRQRKHSSRTLHRYTTLYHSIFNKAHTTCTNSHIKFTT